MTRDKWLIVGIAVGIVLCVAGPVWGLLGTIFGITYSFDKAKDGSTTPSELTHGIDWSLQSTLAGYLAVPVGLALAIVCTVMLVRSRRARVPRSTVEGETQ